MSASLNLKKIKIYNFKLIKKNILKLFTCHQLNIDFLLIFY